eukprot:CAMPEP_0115047052 /NCGR_PEP_ID=MMETSP0216-20121206/49095_1 /TAXON_ID=223996 /ORGANISM="Protocruzia adherens, Strain Boccale" /LENGTH=604 /DNA_ID=CAMNT_0002430211 /DNA_START=17 /DNA_END=1834 /DNA_ORIENTATION=-
MNPESHKSRRKSPALDERMDRYRASQYDGYYRGRDDGRSRTRNSRSRNEYSDRHSRYDRYDSRKDSMRSPRRSRRYDSPDRYQMRRQRTYGGGGASSFGESSEDGYRNRYRSPERRRQFDSPAPRRYSGRGNQDHSGRREYSRRIDDYDRRDRDRDRDRDRYRNRDHNRSNRNENRRGGSVGHGSRHDRRRDYDDSRRRNRHHRRHHDTHKDGPKEKKNRSEDEGHFSYMIGDFITKKYKITKFLGDGTFGRVLECFDKDKGETVAIKIVRAVERYVEAAEIEVDILKKISDRDRHDKSNCVKMVDKFDFSPNYCIVFERLGMSLYDFIKKNHYRGFHIRHIQSFARQLLECLAFLDCINLTHTDLKPENILLQDSEFIKIDNPLLYPLQVQKRSGSISTESSPGSSLRRSYMVPKNETIRVIDFGGATFDDDHHSSIINTRQYRAPEVILGCKQWDSSSDLWSLGCILMELYTGELFFATHDNFEHLALMEKALGAVPDFMAAAAHKNMQKYFTDRPEHISEKGTRLIWPKGVTEVESVEAVEKMKGVHDLVVPEHREFADMIASFLKFDPASRLKAKDALEHPFFSATFDNDPLSSSTEGQE